MGAVTTVLGVVMIVAFALMALQTLRVARMPDAERRRRYAQRRFSSTGDSGSTYAESPSGDSGGSGSCD